MRVRNHVLRHGVDVFRDNRDCAQTAPRAQAQCGEHDGHRDGHVGRRRPRSEASCTRTLHSRRARVKLSQLVLVNHLLQPEPATLAHTCRVGAHCLAHGIAGPHCVQILLCDAVHVAVVVDTSQWLALVLEQRQLMKRGLPAENVCHVLRQLILRRGLLDLRLPGAQRGRLSCLLRRHCSRRGGGRNHRHPSRPYGAHTGHSGAPAKPSTDSNRRAHDRRTGLHGPRAQAVQEPTACCQANQRRPRPRRTVMMVDNSKLKSM